MKVQFFTVSVPFKPVQPEKASLTISLFSNVKLPVSPAQFLKVASSIFVIVLGIVKVPTIALQPAYALFPMEVRVAGRGFRPVSFSQSLKAFSPTVVSWE